MEEKLSSIEENGSRTDETALTITDTAIRDEMAGAIKTFGRPVSDDEKMPTRIARAGRACNLTFSQARRLWYREWQNVPGHIVDSMRARVDRARFVAIEAERKRIAKVMAEINEWERISIARNSQLDRRRVAPGQRHEPGHIEETGCGG